MLTLYCLGNPTLKHKNNRHNAGILLGDFLVKKFNLSLKKFKNYKLSSTFQIDGTTRKTDKFFHKYKIS